MKYFLSLISLLLCNTVLADASAFKEGALIKNFGKSATVKSDVLLDPEHKFNVAFDLGKQGPEDSPNRSIDSLARFLNMHVNAGIKAENINLALVVHGKAAYDLLSADQYEEKFLVKNPNHDLLNELIKNKVSIYLCGQTAAFYGIQNEHLHPGVKMALSAMTTHALLQQQAYTLNPF